MSGRRLRAASLWMFAATMVLNLAMVLYNRAMSESLKDAFGQLAALGALGNVLAVLNIGAGAWLVKVFATDDALGGSGATMHRLRRLALPFLGAVAGLSLLLLPLGAWASEYLHTPLRVYNWVLAAFVGGMLATLLRSAVQGLQRFGWLGVSLAGDGISRVGFALLLVGRGWGVDGALASQLLAQGVGSSLAAVGLGATDKSNTRLTQEPKAWDMAYDTVALGLFSLLCFLDVLVLKHHLDEGGASFYSRAALAAKSFLYLAAALNMVLLPAVAAARAAGRDARPILAKFFGAALGLDLLGLLGVWLLTGWFIRLLCGSGVDVQALIPLVRWLSLAVIPVGLLQLLLYYHLALGSRLPLYVLAVGVPLLWVLLDGAADDLMKVPARLGGVALVLLLVCALGAWKAPQKLSPRS